MAAAGLLGGELVAGMLWWQRTAKTTGGPTRAMTRTSLAQRMSRLEEQKARLARDEAKLRADLSRQRPRRGVEAGQLIERAGLLDLDDQALYGALLSLAEARHDASRLAAWTQSGRLALEEERHEKNQKREPLTVTFPAPLPTAFATRLRAAGLRFDKRLQHWQGFADRNAVAALAAEQNGTVTRVQAKQTESAKGGLAQDRLVKGAVDQNPRLEHHDNQRGRETVWSGFDPGAGDEVAAGGTTNDEIKVGVEGTKT